MMISYSGDSWMGGLNIGSVDEGEMRVDMPGLESHYSKWGEGVYVFFMSNETAGQGGHSDKRDPELGDLRTFLEVVKKAYTPQELREAADGYFQAHPDFNGFVTGKDWPEVFKLKKEMIGRPTFVSVAEDSVGRRGMMVEFAGGFWLEGILIEPSDKVEMQNHLGSRTKFLKWEQGIYVYYSP